MKVTHKQYPAVNGRKLQDFLDYSIRHYDDLGRVVSGALKDPIRSRLNSKQVASRAFTKSGRMKHRLLDFGV